MIDDTFTEFVKDSKRILFQFKVMPFGHKNASATFYHLISEIFRGLGGQFVMVYLDYIVVHLESPDKHLNCLLKELERHWSYVLKYQLKK